MGATVGAAIWYLGVSMQISLEVIDDRMRARRPAGRAFPLTSLMLLALALVSMPVMAGTHLTPAMVQGKWRVVKVGSNRSEPDALKMLPVIRDVELGADGRYVMHWGLGSTQRPGSKPSRSTGLWGLPSGSNTVMLCQPGSKSCNDISACITFGFHRFAQCLDVVSFQGERMRVREKGFDGLVIEYDMERPSRTGQARSSRVEPKISASPMQDYAGDALTEFRSSTGVRLTGLPEAYRRTLAALRGALEPNAREYAEMYLVWYYQSFMHRKEGARPPPVVTSTADTRIVSKQLERLRYMLDLSELLRSHRGNGIYVSYATVIADAGAKYRAEQKAGHRADYIALLNEAAAKRYGVRIDPTKVRGTIAGVRSECEIVGIWFDPLDGTCHMEPLKPSGKR